MVKQITELMNGACQHCGGDGSIRLVNPQWLRDRRRRAGVTMRDMARKLDVSAAYLCDVEHGRRSVQGYVHDAYRKLRLAPAPEGE